MKRPPQDFHRVWWAMMKRILVLPMTDKWAIDIAMAAINCWESGIEFTKDVTILIRYILFMPVCWLLFPFTSLLLAIVVCRRQPDPDIRAEVLWNKKMEDEHVPD